MSSLENKITCIANLSITVEISDTAVESTRQKLKCPVCTIEFGSKYTLKRHWSNQHYDVIENTVLDEYLIDIAAKHKKNSVPKCKLHISETCGKSFTRSNKLKDCQSMFHN